MRTKIIQLFLLSFFLLPACVFAKTKVVPDLLITGTLDGLYVGVDACVLVGEPELEKLKGMDSYQVVVHCVDYEDLTAYHVGMIDRIVVYPLVPYGSSTKKAAQQTLSSAKLKEGNVYTVKLRYHMAHHEMEKFCYDQKCILDMINAAYPGYNAKTELFQHVAPSYRTFVYDGWY